jgi:hypothetical protein
MRVKSDLLNRINVIWVVQSPLAKIFRLTRRANHFYNFVHPASIRGALAIVTNVGRDAVDAAASRAL